MVTVFFKDYLRIFICIVIIWKIWDFEPDYVIDFDKMLMLVWLYCVHLLVANLQNNSEHDLSGSRIIWLFIKLMRERMLELKFGNLTFVVANDDWKKGLQTEWLLK